MRDDKMVVEVDRYNAVGIYEYGGKYSLIALELKGDGVWHKVWVFLSKWRSGASVPDDKKRVMSVKLGDKETAKRVIKAIWEKIKSQNEQADSADRTIKCGCYSDTREECMFWDGEGGCIYPPCRG